MGCAPIVVSSEHAVYDDPADSADRNIRVPDRPSNSSHIEAHCGDARESVTEIVDGCMVSIHDNSTLYQKNYFPATRNKAQNNTAHKIQPMELLSM